MSLAECIILLLALNVFVVAAFNALSHFNLRRK